MLVKLNLRQHWGHTRRGIRNCSCSIGLDAMGLAGIPLPSSCLLTSFLLSAIHGSKGFDSLSNKIHIFLMGLDAQLEVPVSALLALF